MNTERRAAPRTATFEVNYAPLTIQSCLDWAKQLEAELDDADRRAGAAERVLAGIREDVYRVDQCRAAQKTAAGYHRNVSFDVVWDEALAALLEKRGPLPENPQHRL
jgi:hypothetical protein